MTWSETLKLLSPELILGLAGLLVLGMDLVVRQKERLAQLSLLGLALSLIATFTLWNRDATLLSDMYALDPFALFFKVVAILATGLVILASMDYLRGRMRYRGEFYSLLLLAGLAIMLMAGSTDLIMVYLSLEFLSLTSYILAGYLRDDPKSSEAAIKYLLYGATASALMLYGMALLYGATGSTRLSEVAANLAMAGNPASFRWLTLAAMTLLLAGFGFKISLVPFHQWAPDTYEGAPTPITAFLSVGPKAAGFSILLRVMLVALPGLKPDWIALLASISMVTMTLGNLVAISQRNIKRMLAYSSIAQAGYILIGLVSLSPDLGQTINGVNGTLLYVFAYLFANLGAFIAVIAFSHTTHSDDISDYAGLIRRSPWLAASLVIFFMSLAGIPPTGGFVGKLYVFSAAIQRGQSGFYLLAVVGVVNSIISVYYYFNVVRHMFFLPARSEEALKIPVPVPLFVALCLSLAMTLCIGVFPQPFLALASRSVHMLP